ncbi:MAG TPA: hypothetical protein VK923_12765, partial [Euzebyales bacterium]|nr:hypothetical protein [Euzebyales bacterium]
MKVPYMPRVFDRAGSCDSSRIALPQMLPSARTDGVGTPKDYVSRLNVLACTYPYRRFADTLTDA